MIMLKTKKILYACTFMAFMVIWYKARFDNNTILPEKMIEIGTAMAEVKPNPHPDMKYILQWTNSSAEPFIFMGRGQSAFIRRRCLINNCFVTSNRSLLNNLKDFDAVLFHGPELSTSLIPLPDNRSPRQKYVFVSMESSRRYPIIYNVYDGFFNWTWTYKLTSDVYYGYIIIRNKQGDIIGPNEVMHWLKVEEMQPIDTSLKERLNSKRIAAAWFVSNCYATSKRDRLAKLLQKEVAKYNMTVDIYGVCGNKYCPRIHMKKCLKMLETDYYFYFSFENTVTEDYATEKLLHALQHYAVPVVYGGANYTRFMPEGAYLDVLAYSIEGLAKEIVDIINDKQRYYDYFRWTNHYSYHYGEEVPETDYYCDFCSKINNISLVSRISSNKKFRKWWNPKYSVRTMTIGKKS